MRLLSDQQRSGVWSAVDRDLKKYFDTVKDAKFVLKATQTIPGDLEGFFAVLGVNHLMKNGTETEQKNATCEKYGILDLGGSSTQVAVPSDCSDIRRDNSFVRSFPQSGMELTREAVSERFSEDERANSISRGMRFPQIRKKLLDPVSISSKKCWRIRL